MWLINTQGNKVGWPVLAKVLRKKILKTLLEDEWQKKLQNSASERALESRFVWSLFPLEIKFYRSSSYENQRDIRIIEISTQNHVPQKEKHFHREIQKMRERMCEEPCVFFVQRLVWLDGISRYTCIIITRWIQWEENNATGAVQLQLHSILLQCFSLFCVV